MVTDPFLNGFLESLIKFTLGVGIGALIGLLYGIVIFRAKKKAMPPIFYCPTCNEDIPIAEWEAHGLPHLKERAK